MVQLTLLIPTRKWSSSRCYFHRTNGPAHAANSNSQMVQLTLLIPSHKRTTQTSACITLLTKGGGALSHSYQANPILEPAQPCLHLGPEKGKHHLPREVIFPFRTLRLSPKKFSLSLYSIRVYILPLHTANLVNHFTLQLQFLPTLPKSPPCHPNPGPLEPVLHPNEP